MNNDNSFVSKLDLRAQMLEKRTSLPLDKIQQASLRAAEISLAYEPLRDAQTIISYRAWDGELDPQYIENEVKHYGCRVISISMKSSSRTVAALYSLIQKEKPEVVICPVVAATKRGDRLGRGRGFYDQLFATLASTPLQKMPIRLGLAYDWQILPSLPVEEHDIMLDAIITDKRLIRVA